MTVRELPSLSSMALPSFGQIVPIVRTHDVVKRVLKHNDGHGSAFSARRRPVVLVYSETHIDAL
jgi:hypothetical protein